MHRAIIPLASGTPVSEATDGNGIVAKCTKGPERCSEPFGIGIDQPILRAGRFIVVVVRRDDDAANDGNESEDSDDPARAAFEFALAINGRSRASRRRSEEHTSELQSLMRISYAVFCLKK